MAEESKKRRYFGTDGVRDIANRGNMTPEFAMKLGRAYVMFLMAKGFAKPSAAVGRDTRYSGPMLDAALSAGMMSAGADVCSLGVIPTPGVSYVARSGHFSGGAVISASHNPAEYNGIKFLDADGFKLSDDDELLIESYLTSQNDEQRPIKGEVGTMSDGSDYSLDYRRSLAKMMESVTDKSYPVAVDAANGAASAIIGPLFSSWGGKVTLCANEPNGLNINDGVGVTHMDYICGRTVESGSRTGIAYDGDTDRVLMSDSKGRVLDGDIMLWTIGRWMASRGRLGAGVAATVMSNMVLEDLLAKDGIKVFRCGVGDRYVLNTMKERGCRLGGEQSGHIIALDYANTGDGLYSGTLFLTAIAELGEDISTLCDRFDKYPQVLRNMKVTNKEKLMESSELAKASEEAERMLAGRGRMLLRPSGTEPLLRIFVESRDRALMNRVADMLEDCVNRISREALM